MQWQNALIPLGIIVLMSVLGYLTQMLKKTADKRLQEKEREKARERRPAATRSDTADIDRYLRAVDAQRQKPAAKPRATPKAPPPPIPTVNTRKPRLTDTAASAFPEAKPRAPKAAPADDLPVATVVRDTSAAPVVTAPAQLAKPVRASAPPPTGREGAAVPFNLQFAALLKSPNAAALAVALHEVLGPPKCKRG